MDWWWDLLKAMDAHEGQAAWAQFAGSIVALSIALWVGISQALFARRESEERTAAFMAGAKAAAAHANLAIVEVGVVLGGEPVARATVKMDAALHNLDSADLALTSVPFFQAPSARTVNALLCSQRAVRSAKGRLQGTLEARPHHISMSFDAEFAEAGKAFKALVTEEERLVPQRLRQGD